VFEMGFKIQIKDAQPNNQPVHGIAPKLVKIRT
jgi:hypothetical protein